MKLKLTSVSGRNFKCGTFKNKLTPVTIFVGENGKGKTSRINCINIALSGKDPALKKKSSKIDAGQTAADIMAFGCGNPMSAAVGTDDGRNLERVYTDSKGKTTCTLSPDCEGFEVPGVLTDPSAYLNMTLNEQRDYVFGLVPMPDAKDTFKELAAALKNHKFEENTVQTEELIKSMVEIVNHASAVPLPVQEVLEALVVDIKLRKAEAEAAIKRMTGTVQGVTELATEALSDPTPEIEQAKATLERLLGEQRDLQNALTRAQEVQQQRAKIQQQILDLRSPYYVRVAELMATLDALRQSIAGYQSQTVTLEAQVQKLSADRFKAQQDGAKLGQDGLKAQQQVQERTRLEQELAQAQQEALGLAELEAELHKMQERQQVLAKSSRIVEKDVEMLNTCIEELESFTFHKAEAAMMAQCIRLMLSLNGIQVIDTGTLQAQVAVKAAAANKAFSLIEQVNNLPPKVHPAALTTALEAKRTEFRELATQLPILEQKLKESRFSDQKHSANQLTLAQKEAELQRLNEAPRRIKELEEQLATVPVQQVLVRPTLDFEISGQRAALTDLDARYRQYMAQKGNARLRQEALNQRLLLEAESAVAKVAVELVQETQSRMVQESFVEILRVANQVTDGVLPAPLEYRDGEIGMMRPMGKAGCQWVTTRTMSGSEQLCCFAAISVSLAVKSPIRLLLLDEVGRIDAEHSAALMLNLCQMIETGALDNVVICGLSAPQMPAEVAASELVSIIEL